ncbi:transposase [Mesorhizobium sp.]|uniref:transposase n=1 Tax=Mesorhizobium sp. TaxID=1871066 RepID=UPI00338F2890
MINGAGGRRHWSVDDKARIIAETLEPNAIISEVVRRYGLRPQVFAWRREARKQALRCSKILQPLCRRLWRRNLEPAVYRSSGNGKPLEMPA